MVLMADDAADDLLLTYVLHSIFITNRNSFLFFFCDIKNIFSGKSIESRSTKYEAEAGVGAKKNAFSIRFDIKFEIWHMLLFARDNWRAKISTFYLVSVFFTISYNFRFVVLPFQLYIYMLRSFDDNKIYSYKKKKWQ